jgi:UV excision repair protein RAD23
MGGEREAAIANMESMGFARADIDRAMRAAFFNPDRAVEYLLTVGQATLLPFRHVLTSF